MEAFIEGVCSSDPFKVEEDLGHGYVKLRSTEAEKRQAAQDIRCIEDVVIELLRNSRDAHAKNIFIATSKDDGMRTLAVIDDGCGVPQQMWNAIFEPRVTSKLETAHMDKWGMHGRGMALYSTKLNTEDARVVASGADKGTALLIQSGSMLPEKADQSTFPRFEESEGTMVMRGPKNIVRTACEFALESRHDVKVYLGSPAQIARTLYDFGLATLPAYSRAFSSGDDIPLVKSLGLAHSPEDLLQRAHDLGLGLSLRTARRILDGQAEGCDDLATLMARRSFSSGKSSAHKRVAQRFPGAPSARKVHITDEDKDRLIGSVKQTWASMASDYYLAADVEPVMRTVEGKLVIEIPLADQDESDI